MSDRVRILHRTGSAGVGTTSSSAAEDDLTPAVEGGGVPVVEGDLISVTGGSRLVGSVPVEGAKNSALKLMAAALLAPGRTVIDNVPRITDIAIMADVLRGLGCEVTVTAAGAELAGSRATGSPRASTVTIDVPAAPGCRPDVDLVRRLRASICVLGPLLARCGQVRVAHPGGDAIGSRGLDMHVAGLARMGADITGENGLVVASAARGLHGATICLDFPSVGATENLVMAAVLADGITEIDNAAREPEIVDICAMLTAMGAQIDGAGTATLRIEGVPELQPVRHATIGDRIVGGTWAFAAAMTRGDVTVHGVDPAFLEVALDKVADSGASVEATDDGFRVRMDRRPRAVDVVTLPFPGFATDLLPMAIGLAAISEGASLVTENIFDGRFGFVDELLRLGADIKTDGHHAVVRGRERLVGARVTATDIRAGAGLVIAGLCADGVTEIADVHHIDRGYPNYVADLRALGVLVRRYGG
ncbi:UDP-N-acetylglucosamine 1-carboxyvinyltransferase [Solwaraspora sp. WMMA2056]|uniref:UDP-N-acetylglucosamine 1-carboxyvinyltransferase n=1 Tax=Solwaraspora sp. WMMA2056 TaxID=3015161 RepID=UPI00259B3CF3|nr:UDP-N-acetylglucosamine 1-carboxyvinyltransferase [Solwaraspora sp. WMMA2056]WJK42930.1 UDP-N-acetylglucosamine 1-carboxyvinyltransferase [Solwaraspora sp. WMMA2056]